MVFFSPSLNLYFSIMFFNLVKNKEVTERKKRDVPIESNESLQSLMESKSKVHGNKELYYIFNIMKVSVWHNLDSQVSAPTM